LFTPHLVLPNKQFSFLPESPRYLISKDRREEAFDILSKYHAEGDRNNVIVLAEMAQIETTIKLELVAAKLTWLDLFKTAGMRKRAFLAMMIGLFTQWSGNTLISYYFFTILATVGITDPKTKQGINLGKEAWALINAVTIALFITRFKRRRMYLLCTTCMLIVYVSWTTCQGIYVEAEKKHKIDPSFPLNKTAGSMAIFFIFLYSPAYNIGFNSLTYTYLVELFPYAERTRGLAFFQFFGRGAAFFATFVNPIGLDKISWRWLLVYCCWVLFEIVVIYFFFPETYNRTLEELSFCKFTLACGLGTVLIFQQCLRVRIWLTSRSLQWRNRSMQIQQILRGRMKRQCMLRKEQMLRKSKEKGHGKAF